MQRECLHPDEIPPDPAPPRAERVVVGVVVTLLVCMCLAVVSAFGYLIYDTAFQAGKRSDDARRWWLYDCKIYGVDNDCLKPYKGPPTGDEH